MKIYTSCYSNAEKYKDCIAVAISLTVPKDFKGYKFTHFMPSWEILNDYKRFYNKEKYIKSFYELLERRGFVRGKKTIEFKAFISGLQKISKGKDIVLLCYEKKNDFCHRHLVADYINSVMKREVVKEL